MSVYSEDNTVSASSESFWEVGQYKRTVKRMEEGHRLCSDLNTLIQERSEIEKAYAKSLKHWAVKWNALIEKGPEYGTMTSAWKGVTTEAENKHELHMEVKDKLLQEVYPSIKQWQKENYHKKMMNFKEVADAEEGFKKAQKPWVKLLNKVNQAKKAYHNSCKMEKTALTQEANAKDDDTLSPEQQKKFQDKVEKCRQDKERTCEKYETALEDINAYNPRYMEDMANQFTKTQEFEEKRLTFFKKALLDIHRCLDLSVHPNFGKTYTDFQNTLQSAEAEKDLKWWKNTHGIGMAMNWPAFEEYSESDRNISNKKNKGNVSGADGITLTGVVSAYKASSNFSQSSNPPSHNPGAPTDRNNGADMDDHNPFDEDDEAPRGNDDTYYDTAVGVPVKALYDYEGAEDDELTFQAGTIFTKLEDEDEQGWCKGRINGKVGLYPANYVEAV